MGHLSYFISLYAQTLGFILLFGLTGYFLIQPFCSRDNFVIFFAPAAGVMFLGLGCAILYGYAAFPFKTAFYMTSISGIFLSFAALLSSKKTLPECWKKISLMLFILLGMTVYLCNYHSIHYAEPALLLAWGSDHLGYANVTDWLANHTTQVWPQLTATDLSQAWPHLCFTIDHRFGVYYFYAAILALKSVPALFLYNFVLGIGFCIGVLGVIATWTKKTSSAFFLGIALLFSTLFELGLSGFLGKILCYLSVFSFAGLFLNDSHLTLKKHTRFFVLALGLCTLYPGQAISFILIGALLGPVFFQTLFPSPHRKPFAHLELGFIITLLPFIFNGLFSLPQNHLVGDVIHPIPYWDRLLVSAYSLTNIDYMQSIFSPSFVYGLAHFIVTANLLVAINAFIRKNYITFAYLLFPIAWLCIALTKRTELAYFISYEFLGLSFIMTIIALIHMLDYAEQTQWRRIILLGLIFIDLIGCFGHFRKEVSYFNPRMSQKHVLVYSQMQGLNKAMEGKNIFIDMQPPMMDPLVPFLAIEGAHEKNPPNMHWSKNTWPIVLHFLAAKDDRRRLTTSSTLTWQLQVADKPALLKNCVLNYRTNQYFLYECHHL